jgi:gluconolactonase
MTFASLGMTNLTSEENIMQVTPFLKRIMLAATLSFAVTTASFAADPGFPAPTGDPSFVPAGAKLDQVFDGGCVLTEGVAAGHDGMIYFSDITFTKFCKDPSGKYLQAGNIWKHNPKTGETTIFRSPSGMSNGLKFDREGNMIAALGADYGGRMLVKTDMKSGKTYVLAGMFEGKEFNALNDITIDQKGRIYFTDPRYLGHEPIRADGFAAYRLDPDGKVSRVATDCGKCNGILISPDQKTMYIVSNDNGWLAFENLKEGEKTLQGPHMLQAYDIDAASGNLSNRRTLIDYGKLDKPCSGPDGMIMDSEGNIWLASRCEWRPGIQVLNPQGKELAYISTGKELPTNVGFGRGDDANLLWVTSGKSLYKIRVGKKGYQLP